MSENKQPRKLNTAGARKGSPAPKPAAAKPAAKPAVKPAAKTAAKPAAKAPAAKPAARKPGKKRPLWQPLVACLLVVCLALGGLYWWVVRSISPNGTPSLPELIRTPSEYKGDVVNVLVAGVDYEEGRSYGNDADSNDGMTDMIMYVSFDVANKKISMMQIPRNLLVGDYAKASNGQINSVALSGGGIPALAEAVNDQLKLPVDHWVSIDMQSLKEVVNVFGGVWVTVPHDIAYGGSYIPAGYRKLDGDAAEFFVRNRKGEGYANSDLDRLMMQRYFYQGLLREFREMTVWDAAKMVPVATSYVKTSMDTGTIVSLAVSLLKVDSADIMLCRMPVYQSAQYYNGNSVVVGDAAGTADLLNQYFRTYSEPVPAEELHLFPWPTSGAPFDAGIQFMGQLDTEGQQAQQDAGIGELD